MFVCMKPVGLSGSNNDELQRNEQAGSRKADTSLGMTCWSTLPSTSWSRAATGVSLAVLTVSLRTCWQYLSVDRNVIRSHRACLEEVFPPICVFFFLTVSWINGRSLIWDRWSDGLQSGPEISPELRDLVQGNWIRTQNLFQLLVQFVLNFLWGGQEVKRPDTHCQNTTFYIQLIKGACWDLISLF